MFLAPISLIISNNAKNVSDVEVPKSTVKIVDFSEILGIDKLCIASSKSNSLVDSSLFSFREIIITVSLFLKQLNARP